MVGWEPGVNIMTPEQGEGETTHYAGGGGGEGKTYAEDAGRGECGPHWITNPRPTSAQGHHGEARSGQLQRAQPRLGGAGPHQQKKGGHGKATYPRRLTTRGQVDRRVVEQTGIDPPFPHHP